MIHYRSHSCIKINKAFDVMFGVNYTDLLYNQHCTLDDTFDDFTNVLWI